LCPEDGEGPFLLLRRPFMFVVAIIVGHSCLLWKKKRKQKNPIHGLKQLMIRILPPPYTQQWRFY